MRRSYDHRQLVAARGALQRALTQTSWAVERLEEGAVESSMRALFAVREAEAALTELRRFTKRNGFLS